MTPRAAFLVLIGALQACASAPAPRIEERCSEYALRISDQTGEIGTGYLLMETADCRLRLDPAKKTDLGSLLSRKMPGGWCRIKIHQKDDLLNIQVLPEVEDDQVWFTGRVAGDKIVGILLHATLRGPQTVGEFVAICFRKP
jgi:hypothetical protein